MHALESAVASHWTRSKETNDFREVAEVGDGVIRSWQVAAFQLQKQTIQIMQKGKLTIAFASGHHASNSKVVIALWWHTSGFVSILDE